MNITHFFPHIKEAFDCLWQFKIRGETIEIITPFSTLSSKFISVFITTRGAEFIVSDGGWTESGMYETQLIFSEDCFINAFSYYRNFYEVSNTTNVKGDTVYYKKTREAKLISNIVYDICNFILLTVNSSITSMPEKDVMEDKETFRKEANNYIAALIDKDKLKFNSFLGEDMPNIRFSVVATKTPSKLILINYITGSQPSYFINSVSRANMNFEMISNSKYDGYIDKKIALVNDLANGYTKSKIEPYLEFMEKHNNTKNISWTDKDKLQTTIY